MRRIHVGMRGGPGNRMATEVTLFLVLQTFLWGGSTLSRMAWQGGVRWTAWNCTDNCLA